MAQGGDVNTVYFDDADPQGRSVMRRKEWKPATDRGVIFCNGWSMRAKDMISEDSSRLLCSSIAREGFTVTTSDFTSVRSFVAVDGWGNTDVISKVGAMKTWTQSSTLGDGQSSTGNIILVGVSMGACTALNYAQSVSGANISAIALLNPALSPYDIQNAPRDSLLQQSIWTAFGNGTQSDYLLNGLDYDPNTHRTQIGAMNIPIRIWYSNNDPTAYAPITRDFATSTRNVTLRDCGANGHAITGYPWEEIATWVKLYA